MREEVGNCLQMLDEVYAVFGLKYTAELSTRPDSRMGEEHQWDTAETALREALESQEAKTGHGWGVSLRPACRLNSCSPIKSSMAEFLIMGIIAGAFSIDVVCVDSV